MARRRLIEACRPIRESRPETKVLILTAFADEDAVLAAILAGASGFVLKQTRGRDLGDAVAAGHPALGEVLARLRTRRSLPA